MIETLYINNKEIIRFNSHGSDVKSFEKWMGEWSDG
jgi:hypothetical protein